MTTTPIPIDGEPQPVSPRDVDTLTAELDELRAEVEWLRTSCVEELRALADEADRIVTQATEIRARLSHHIGAVLVGRRVAEESMAVASADELRADRSVAAESQLRRRGL